MRVILQLAAAFTAAYLILAGGVCLLAEVAGAQDINFDGPVNIVFSEPDEIMPVNAPEIQTKTIHIQTADERSTILINDIWKPPELDRVKIGKGAALGAIREAKAPIEPYGWQAFVGQDAIGSWRGSAVAMAYGGL